MTHTAIMALLAVLAILLVASVGWLLAKAGIQEGVEHDRHFRRPRTR